MGKPDINNGIDLDELALPRDLAEDEKKETWDRGDLEDFLRGQQDFEEILRLFQSNKKKDKTAYQLRKSALVDELAKHSTLKRELLEQLMDSQIKAIIELKDKYTKK